MRRTAGVHDNDDRICDRFQPCSMCNNEQISHAEQAVRLCNDSDRKDKMKSTGGKCYEKNRKKEN